MVEKKKKEEIEEGFEPIDTVPRNMEVGEVITAKFVGTRPGKWGSIFMLDSSTGERYNIFGGVQFASVLTPGSVGKTFRIKYLGKVPTSKGQEVHTYKFAVKREKIVEAP